MKIHSKFTQNKANQIKINQTVFQWLISLPNLFSKFSYTKMPTLPTLCITEKLKFRTFVICMRHRNSCTSNINSLPRRDPFACIVLAPFSRLIFTLKPSFPLPVVIHQETVKVRSQASQSRNHKLHCDWTTCSHV